MIKLGLFEELSNILIKNNCEVLNNKDSEDFFQFIYKNTTYKISRASGHISPYILDTNSSDVNKEDKENFEKVISFLDSALKTSNIDKTYKYATAFNEDIKINNIKYKLIMEYNGIILCYMKNGNLGVSYHIFTQNRDENILYNFKDAIMNFKQRSNIACVKELSNENEFSLSELSAVIYSLSKISKISRPSESSIKEITSFIIKASKIITSKNNIGNGK